MFEWSFEAERCSPPQGNDSAQIELGSNERTGNFKAGFQGIPTMGGLSFLHTNYIFFLKDSNFLLSFLMQVFRTKYFS